MKKAIVFLLAILYVTITSGVVVNIHYCMGNLASVEYGVEKDNACSQCGMNQKKSCCHTEHKLIKASEAHLSVENLSSPLVWSAAISPVYHFSSEYYYNSPIRQYARSHSPSDTGPSIYIYNCVFRV